MRKILIVGEFDDDTSEMATFLAKHFATQLCTDNSKILKSMLKMYSPDLIIMDIDNFDLMHNEVYMAIEEYSSSLPVITFGNEKQKTKFISFYYTGQCKHAIDSNVETIVKMICQELNMDEDVVLRGAEEIYKKHIIVVDDNPVLLRNMRNMLQEKYRVSLATSAAQCMKIMGQDKPDLIILDYEMPVVDGKQTLEMIRSDEEFKAVPVIFLTGIADKPHVDAVLDLKPAGYFVKPPMQTKILSAIENILNK